MRSICAGLLFLLAASPIAAQGPDADWRTLSTPHFRVHYPAPSEAWAERAAARLESIRERVSREVGYAPPEVTDVVVTDPIARANGSAWPIQGWPRMVLWTTPPAPASVIGHYRDWGELLAVHEDTHLVHLLRPSRNPLERLGSRLLPLGPIAKRAPRWVIEGYATLLEGQLTGYGRPHGDLRATVLRRWAQLGELPSYGRMSADSGSWLGMSMAYLLGSAYLEWLRERAGPESLRHLWARLSARQGRSFEEAFAGVFGDSPSKLYNRFRAELTYRAMRLEELVEPGLRTGELWQDLSWTSGAPAVSPDGERLAIVLRSRKAPPRLVVWSTGPDPEAEKIRAEARRKLIERDPEDVPAVRAKPPRRKPLHELTSRNGAEPFAPRWLPDGRSLLYVRSEPDGDGFLRPDLFQWTPETGRVRRLTRGAAVRDPDPDPTGTWAVAVRHRHGLSQLVRVELAGGGVEPLTPAAVEVVYDHPRISPDGSKLAFVRHSQGAWRLVVRELGSGAERQLETPPRATVAYPAWSADGRVLYAAVGEHGFIDLHAFEVASGAARAVTRSHGAALAPAPAPGGGLFYLGLAADGLDLRYLAPESEPAPVLAEIPNELAPAVRPPAPEDPEPFATAEVGEAEPYGAGRLELLPLLGGRVAPSAQSWEVGGRGGDLLGRLDAVALAGGGRGGTAGGALALAWRGWPVELAAHLALAEERPSEQPTSVPGLGERLDLDRQGLELAAAWSHRTRQRRLRLELGGYLGDLEPAAGAELSQRVAFLRAQHRSQQAVGSWRFSQRLAAGAAAGRTGGDGWNRLGGEVELSAGRKKGTRLGLTWQRHRATGAERDFDRLQLGGVAGSLLPRSAIGGRVHVPALPVGTAVGDEHEGQRLDLRLGRWPVRLFYERHRLWPEGAPRGGWLALRGIELRLARAPWPLLRLPALELRLGLAEILDAPFEDEVEGWLALSWRP